MKQGRILVFSAPSGSGKTTLVRYLMSRIDNLHFSVSATSRQPRGTEQDGVDYYFMTPEEFRRRIANDEFIEYEEVYADKFYGTLKAQVEQQLARGENIVLDIDVKGAVNVKRLYGEQALLVFVQPPSIEALRQRLEGRATDSAEQIEQRIGKASYEMGFAKDFDVVVTNDDLETAKAEIYDVVSRAI